MKVRLLLPNLTTSHSSERVSEVLGKEQLLLLLPLQLGDLRYNYKTIVGLETVPAIK